MIDSFKQLFEMTAPDFSGIYQRLRELDVIKPGAEVPEDQRVAV